MYLGYSCWQVIRYLKIWSNISPIINTPKVPTHYNKVLKRGVYFDVFVLKIILSFKGISPTLASGLDAEDVQTIDLDLGASREGSRTGMCGILRF